MSSTTALATATRPATAVATRAEAKTQAKKSGTPARRKRNPLAAIPYLIGIAILTLEALFLV